MSCASHASLQGIRERVIEASRSRTALRLRGSGTKDFYGEHLEGEVLDLRAYRGLTDYEPAELVISARCGTPLSEIESLLASRGQFLAFEPPAFGGDPTIGGVIAAGLSGPRRMQAGAARDFVLGAKLLDARGEELRFGGRVMKNVAGFDVARLLCGSLGFLGVITEVSLKVLPLPRSEQTRALELPPADAIAVFNRWGSLPLPISAAAWIDGRAWVRLSGAEPAVRSAAQRIGGEAVEGACAAGLWGSLRHFTHPFFANAPLWRVSVPAAAALAVPAAMALTAPAAKASAPAAAIPVAVPAAKALAAPAAALLIDWGGALRWYAGEFPGGAMRALASSAGGTAMGWSGTPAGSRFHPLSAAILDIHRRLKQHFDPHEIFNRGRLLAAAAGS